MPNYPFTQPRVIYNPHYNDQFQQQQPQSRYNYRQQQQQEPVDVQIARSMLMDGDKLTPQHRARLNSIIGMSGDDETQQMFRSAGMQERQALLKAATDPNNPLSLDEFDEAQTDLQNRYGAVLGLPPVHQLYKAEAQKENPVLANVQTAQTLAKQFDTDPDYVSSLFTLDPKTGRPTETSMKNVMNHLENKGKPSSTQITAIDKALDSQTSLVDRMQTNPLLFDQETGLKLPRPSGESEARTYDQLNGAFEHAVTRRQSLFDQQQMIADPSYKPYAPQAPFPIAPLPEEYMKLVAPPMFTNPPPISQASPPVSYSDKLSPTGRQMAVVNSAQSFNALLASGKLSPGDFFTDENGRMAKVGPDGTPIPVR